jgi:clorobiocin biosynthesis protein Clo-hal
MTVGAVINTACFEHRLQDVELETFFWEMLRSCPEVADLVADATLRDDILPNGGRVSACQDWSSWANNPVKGFVCGRPAAVDPRS